MSTSVHPYALKVNVLSIQQNDTFLQQITCDLAIILSYIIANHGMKSATTCWA